MKRQYVFRQLKKPDYWCFVAALGLTEIFWQQPILLTILLLGLFVVLAKTLSKVMIGVALISGILGVLAELVAIRAGAWSYALPQLFGVPVWLFFLWALAAVFFRRLQLDLEHLAKLKKAL